MNEKPFLSNTRFPPVVAYVAPFVAHMLLGSFNPDFSETASSEDAWQYLIVLIIQLVVVGGLLFYFRQTYARVLSLAVSPVAFLLGVVGFFLWIFVAGLGIETWLMQQIGFGGSGHRPSFNPAIFENTLYRYLFLAVRFSVLVVSVPLIEELLVRGWLVKWIEEPDFGMSASPPSRSDQNVSLKRLGFQALIAASIYGVLTHPGEAIAAFLWFGMVTLLATRTGRIADCVVVHAVTNLMLGIYVLWFQQWHLW